MGCNATRIKETPRNKYQSSSKELQKRDSLSQKFLKSAKKISENRELSKEAFFSVIDINKVYDIDMKVLGKGQFGEVRLASLKNQPSKKFVIKVLKKTTENMKYFQSELSIMRDLDHPNIIKFCENYVSRVNYYIVMEYCKGNNLRDELKQMKKFQEPQVRQIFFQMALGVNYLHHIGICHRDLKLENFLFSDQNKNKVKLIDFGLAQDFFRQKKMNEFVGTPYYVSPEILYKVPYTEKCDIWSLGVCLFKMLTGCYPFPGRDFDELLHNIMREDYCKEELLDVSPEVKDLLDKIFVKNPDK